MAEEHFFPAGDFPSALSAVPFFTAGPYAPPGLDVAAMATSPFGMLMPWAASAELPLPTGSTATATVHFDSALSSLVSSPVNHPHAGAGDDVAAIGDLIGRLGSICSNAGSANNSCYSTPLSSPPRGGASPAVAFRQGAGGGYLEPGGHGMLSRVASSKSFGAAAEAEASPTVAADNKAETPAKGGSDGATARKRKASGKGKTAVAAAAANNVSPKRSKPAAGDGNVDAEAAKEEEKVEPEPVKDYIHVRARRGQATDSHSLAERVRREKISERMKLLQSLVPGCNKITGKALMLDEIINYVQSLQRQVDFLSMKLSTMNPQVDVDAPHQYLLPSDKDMMMHHQATMLGYGHHQDDAVAAFSYADPFAGAMNHRTMESCTSSSLHGFGGWDAAAPQDLQSIVHLPQMQSPPAQRPHDDGSHGGPNKQHQEEAATVSHMKVEP
ncbi:hypothetical protein QOZ80_4AG0321900 [Eleusine coracana subsp. coracana]|nr:hypothetical protein QOZ80_4AG0321900 [Eleusine coracana subsp. coracana]